MDRHRPCYPEPSEVNGFLAEHVGVLLRNHRAFTGRELMPSLQGGETAEAEAKRLYEAPFFVASHDGADDPILTYGNLVAQRLFERTWEEFTGTPSRLTAEAPEREERARFLEKVSRQGYIDHYAGVRISTSGRRFRIEQATVWNLRDEDGGPLGQAATFSRWVWL